MPTAAFSCGTTTGSGIASPAWAPREKASMIGAKSVPALARSQSMPRAFSTTR